MTITDAMIEAGARALCRSDQLSPDALVTNLTAFRGQPLWKTYAVKAKAALEAAERAAWRPIEEAPDDGDPILVTGGAKHGQQVNCVPADGGWWRMQIGQLSAIPTHFRPLPTPGEPDER